MRGVITKSLVNPFFRLSILLCILAALVFVTIDKTGVKSRIDNIVFETYMKSKPRPASGKMVFVDIDDESLSRIGQWPWPRRDIASLITNIDKAGAKVIIFDGVLAEPDRTSPENIMSLLDEDHPAREALKELPQNDEVLADAIKRTGKFVTGFSYGSNPSSPRLKKPILVKKDVKSFLLNQKNYSDGYFKTTARFLPALEKAAAGNGSFMAIAENDSVIRRTGLIFHNDKQLYPSLVLEGLRIYENDGREIIKVGANEDYSNMRIEEPLKVEVGEYEIPIGSDGKMWVYFRHFLSDENISAYQFIQTGEDSEHAALPDLTGKIVFIASSAEGLMDLRATPIGMQPGVRVHMNAMEQILQGQFLVRPYTANDIEIGMAVIVSLLIIILSFFIGPVWLAGIVVSASAASFWGAWHLFTTAGGLFDPVAPTIIVTLVFISAAIFNFLKTEFEKRQVSDAFGLYISPDFMKELTADPEKLALGGEIRELSVMFTDIRNFTSISEGLTPQELIQLMNDFLTPMSDLVMQNRGTIDKYMGDAMMAFWNAPLDDEDHAKNACIAALGMQKAIEPINEDIRKKAKEQGKDPVLLNAGIGINTGPCAVGNMGSKQRFAYSTLGDAVNLASRLEGQTKNYGVNILIGEATYQSVQDFACLEMDKIRVKGKSEAVRIFALLGDESLAQEDAFKALQKNHEDMIECYQGGVFADARDYLEKTEKSLSEAVKVEAGLGVLKTVYNLYRERCESLIEQPPESWDGIYTATTK